MEEVEQYSSVPPGFRFHPTEEELVGYYLTRKVASQKLDIKVIADVDLYRIEPWDLQGRCNSGNEDRNEFYFFSHKDKKYPTGTRTNRATAAGFWKATGRDKAVFSTKSKYIIGMRKTLVFYVGRAPNGRKSDWIMHEYRLPPPPQPTYVQEEGWVVCRAFRKPTPSTHHQQPWSITSWNNTSNDNYNDHQLPELDSKHLLFQLPLHNLGYSSGDHHVPCDLLPQLPPDLVAADGAPQKGDGRRDADDSEGELIDWKALDRLLGSHIDDSIGVASTSDNTNWP